MDNNSRGEDAEDRNVRRGSDAVEGVNDLRDGIDPGDPLTKSGRAKKKRTRDADDPEDPNSYRYKACHIRRAFCLFGHIPKLINDGIKRRVRAAAGELDLTFVQSDRDFASFSLIMEHLGPGIEEDIMRLRNKPKEFRKLVNKIKEAADQARNNDNACLKRDVACMLTPDGTSVLQAIRKGVNSSSKADRGFFNDVMGRYLCPIKFDWDDAVVRKQLRDGEHAVLASTWPCLLYANCRCDPDDLELGLGRNTALVRVVKYLMTGRSSAFSDTAGGKTTRAGNAALAGMNEISPRLVAYGACLLRFALSTQESWSQYDNEFNLEEFYWNIVDIFDDADEFGQQLTAWWNFQVFGTSLEAAQGPVDVEESSISILRCQRAAKRARIFYDSTNSLQLTAAVSGYPSDRPILSSECSNMLPPIASITPQTAYQRPPIQAFVSTNMAQGVAREATGGPLSSMAHDIPLIEHLRPSISSLGLEKVAANGTYNSSLSVSQPNTFPTLSTSNNGDAHYESTSTTSAYGHSASGQRSSLTALNAAINMRHP